MRKNGVNFIFGHTSGVNASMFCDFGHHEMKMGDIHVEDRLYPRYYIQRAQFLQLHRNLFLHSKVFSTIREYLSINTTLQSHFEKEVRIKF